MRQLAIAAAGIVVLIVGAAATMAARQTTTQPGQMTPARVWVQNRGSGEAVPVDVREVNLEKPLKVRVTNGEPGSGDVVPTRSARQGWDYETVDIAPGKDVAAVLNVRGALGWEAVGIVSLPANSITILLKRPR